MRDLLLSSTLLLAACAAATPNEAAPVRGGDNGKTCDASNTSQFIGKTASPETQAAIQVATNSASLRLVHPDEMVTMEFSAGRVTVHVDSADKILRIVCG